ncbi:MAG TPA: rhomboid family intramembrane serine protease [Candidatus Angelobacter sp.]
MARTGTFQFGFPRFHGAVREIVLLTVGIWILLVLLTAFHSPLAGLLLGLGTLAPSVVVHDWAIWQFLTYGFLHLAPGHIFATMLGVFFIGSSVQEVTGKRAFYELYLSSLIGAGILGFLFSLTGYIGAGTALGAGAAGNALLMVFYLFYRGASIYLFPFPFQIPVKWVVIIFAGIEGAYWLLNGFMLFFLVNLLGLGTGYLWHRFMWRRAGIGNIIADRIFGLRNSYHRWKRRRAGRKFQVYMRKHEHDPKQYFDEYGNFKPPDDTEKKNGGKGGWIN